MTPTLLANRLPSHSLTAGPLLPVMRNLNRSAWTSLTDTAGQTGRVAEYSLPCCSAQISSSSLHRKVCFSPSFTTAWTDSKLLTTTSRRRVNLSIRCANARAKSGRGSGVPGGRRKVPVSRSSESLTPDCGGDETAKEFGGNGAAAGSSTEQPFSFRCKPLSLFLSFAGMAKGLRQESGGSLQKAYMAGFGGSTGVTLGSASRIVSEEPGCRVSTLLLKGTHCWCRPLSVHCDPPQ